MKIGRIKIGRRPVLFAGGFALLLAIAAAAVFRPGSVPEFIAVKADFKPSEAYLLDRHGEVLDTERLNFGVRRFAWVGLDEVSPAFVDAVVGGEDRRFLRHHGVDWRSTFGAVRDEFILHRHRGASTITMQLATLLSPRAQRGAGTGEWSRKLVQVRFAVGLEARWSKHEILEAYFNLLNFRGEVQGIGAASQLLVGKLPSSLSQSESLVLAALLPNPGADLERLSSRACARARAQRLSVSCGELREVSQTLLTRANEAADARRLAPQLAHALLRTPGERVLTTLDAPTQRLARDVLGRQLAALAARNARDGAVLIVDNASGDVLAYVGSAGPNSRAHNVDGVRAARQAGSTLKPFLYELALERRYLTAASLLKDSPLNLDTAGGSYIPQDYDHDFKGLVSVRTALAGSLNVPAVRTLVLVGVEALRNRLHALGYEGITESGDFYGYSLALGSAEVTLWEQARAYRSLARGGQWSDLRLRADRPADSPDDHPADPPYGTNRALLPEAARFIVGDILSDRAARAITFGLDSDLNTSFWSAVKTGTSKDMRDNWCIGFSRRFTVAVWVGNFEGDSMHEVSGVTGAAPVWHELMEALQQNTASTPPTPPDGVLGEQTHFSPAIEPPRHEWFLAATEARRVVAVTDNSEIARISSPANGMIVAVDPDIPQLHQRLPIDARGARPGMVLRLNDAVLGPATRQVLWAPQPGAHRLTLEDARGQTLDRVLFTVR